MVMSRRSSAARSAESQTVGSHQRHASVKTDMRLAFDQRVVLKTRVQARVRHLKDFLSQNRIGAEGNLPRGLALVHAGSGTKPLSMLADDGHQRDGHLEVVSHHVDDVIQHFVCG
jgi:hypothetical protein